MLAREVYHLPQRLYGAEQGADDLDVSKDQIASRDVEASGGKGHDDADAVVAEEIDTLV